MAESAQGQRFSGPGRGPIWPHPPRVMLVLVGIVAAVVALIAVRTADLAFALAGLSTPWAFAVLPASLLGSALNIPVARLPTNLIEVDYAPIRFGGMVYLVPLGRPGRVTVAVNVTGWANTDGLLDEVTVTVVVLTTRSISFGVLFRRLRV